MSKITKKTSKKLSRSTSSIDIHIKKIKYQEAKDFDISSLTIEFSGADINISFLNAIRRISLDEIPVYAFPSELIKIESNTSIFNNDEMRLRLSQLPILECDSGLDYLETKYLNTGLNFDDQNYVKYEKEKVIEIYINSYNNTPDNINVTTNDINFIEDGEPKNKYSAKHPILLIQLKPNETFKAHLKAGLSNGLRSSIFSAASNTFYDYDEEKNKVLFTIESQGQLSEYTILNKSVNYIIKKLNDFEEYFKNKLKENTKYEKNSTQIFEFENEDHTIGEIINTVFQDHPKVIFSGISKPSPLERLIKIKIAADNNPLEYMLEGIDYLKNVYNQILKELKSIN